MKKMLAFLLATCLAISAAACACADAILNPQDPAVYEMFTFSEGIRFGMTAEDVAAAATELGYRFYETTDVYTFFDENGDYRGREGRVFVLSDVLPTDPGTRLTCYFNDNNQMFALVYTFGTHTLQAFDEIHARIAELYPDRLHSYQDELHYATPKILDYLMMNQAVYSVLDEYPETASDEGAGNYSCVTYDYVQIGNDYRVCINHALCYTENEEADAKTMLEVRGKHYLEYHIFSMEDLAAMQAQ